ALTRQRGCASTAATTLLSSGSSADVSFMMSTNTSTIVHSARFSCIHSRDGTSMQSERLTRRSEGGFMSAVTLSLLGAGHRGAESGGVYCLRFHERAREVAVAEPDPVRMQQFVEAHRIPPEGQFRTWQDLLAQPRLSDALVVATPDQLRDGPVVTGARKGYALLVEKP